MPSNIAAAASAAPLVFRGDAAEVGFPWAGAMLLVLLVAVALVVRWRAGRGVAAMPAWLRPWLKTRTGTAVPPTDLELEASLRVDPQTQLHAVRWGGRRLLIATSTHGSAVLMDSVAAPAATPSSGAPP